MVKFKVTNIPTLSKHSHLLFLASPFKKSLGKHTLSSQAVLALSVMLKFLDCESPEKATRFQDKGFLSLLRSPYFFCLSIFASVIYWINS